MQLSNGFKRSPNAKKAQPITPAAADAVMAEAKKPPFMKKKAK